jgi:serine/threonine protein kinase/tetratricopeptide (TPR) repeat protein
VSEFAGNERYEVRGRLGAGAHGSVYRAFDRETRREVALKVLKQRRPDALRRFKAEFRGLAEVSHPNLATLYELHTDGEVWFFAMELIEGLTFDQAVRRAKGERIERVVGLAMNAGEVARLAALDGTFVDSSAEPPQPESNERSRIVVSRGGVGSTQATAVASEAATAVDLRGTLGDTHADAAAASPIMEGGDAGVDAAARCRPLATTLPSPVRDFDRLRAWLRDLAGAVAFLHRTGRLHRDLKPSNVLVDVSGRVVLLDFGLVVATDAIRERDLLAGTPAYMAPEVCGGDDPSPASDWYSFGALMYVLLTGEYPFIDQGMPAMWAKQLVEARPPHSVVAGIPLDLAALCAELLLRDPRQRPSGRDVVTRLGGDPPNHPASDPSAAALIGRERELGRLRDALAESRAGHLVLATVEAASGMGKTHLLDELVATSRGPAAPLVLRSRCYERDGVPYKALDGAIDELHIALSEDAVPRIGLEGELQRLGRLFPVLHAPSVASARGGEDRRGGAAGEDRRGGAAGEGAVRPRPEGARAERSLADAAEVEDDPGRARRQAGEALARVLTTIGEQRPVVVVIDDLQWADADSLHLLRDTFESATGSRAAICFVLALREGGRASNAEVKSLLDDTVTLVPSAQHRVAIRLQPLDAHDVRRLAQRVLGAVDDELLESLIHESDGSPLLVRELATWSLRGDQPGGRADYRELLRRRVAELPEDARKVLSLLAIAAAPLPIRLLASGATVDVRTLNLLQQAHLVRTARVAGSSAGEAEVSTFHDRVREAVVDALDPTERRALHRTLARAGEDTGLGRTEFLAVHYAAAGDHERACVHFIRAAERAAEVLAFAQAAAFYRAAIELGATGRHTALAEALRNAGRGLEAARAFVDAAAHAIARQELREARRLRALAVEQYLFSGAYDEGAAVIREALREVGVDVAQGMVGALARFAWQSLRLQARGLDFVSRDPTPSAELAASRSPTVAAEGAGDGGASAAERIDLLWMATIGLSMASPLASQSIQKRHLRFALDLGDDYRVARALAVELAFSGLAGGLDERRSRDLSRRGHEVADRSGVPHAKGIVVMSDGGVHWLRGRWSEALDCVTQAIEIYETRCRGVTWELDTARIVQTNGLLHMGRFPEFRAKIAELVADARERGDLYLEVQLRTRGTAFLHVIDGEPERAREEADAAISRWTPHGYHIVHFWRLFTKVSADLHLGQADRAVALLEADDKGLRGSLLLLGQYYRALHLDLVARANAAATRRDRARRKRAEAAARKLVKEKMPWTIAHGHATLGTLAFQQGDTSAARTHWMLARTGFEGASMAVDALACAAALSRIEQDASRDLGDAASFLAALGVASPRRYLDVLLPIGW